MSDVCGDEALHCETARKMREESRDYSRAMMEEERLRKAAEARADKAEAERDRWQSRADRWMSRCEELLPDLNAAEAERDNAKTTLMWLVDRGLVDPMHDPDCPEDDTCRCEVANRINDALAVLEAGDGR